MTYLAAVRTAAPLAGGARRDAPAPDVEALACSDAGFVAMGPERGTDPPAVRLVDDDDDIRDAFGALLRASGFTVETFATVEDLRAGGRLGAPGCLLLDVRLPGQSGLDLQADLVAAGTAVPVVFMSGQADRAMMTRAMNNGAVAFLAKPVRAQALIDAVTRALAQDAARRA